MPLRSATAMPHASPCPSPQPRPALLAAIPGVLLPELRGICGGAERQSPGGCRCGRCAGGKSCAPGPCAAPRYRRARVLRICAARLQSAGPHWSLAGEFELAAFVVRSRRRFGVGERQHPLPRVPDIARRAIAADRRGGDRLRCRARALFGTGDKRPNDRAKRLRVGVLRHGGLSCDSAMIQRSGRYHW
jgi:hypothetical protein